LNFRGKTQSHNAKPCTPVSLQERSSSLLGKLISARSLPKVRKLWTAREILRMLPTRLYQARDHTAAMEMLPLQLLTQRSLLYLSLTQIRACLWQVSTPNQLRYLQCAAHCFFGTHNLSTASVQPHSQTLHESSVDTGVDGAVQRQQSHSSSGALWRGLQVRAARVTRKWFSCIAEGKYSRMCTRQQPKFSSARDTQSV